VLGLATLSVLCVSGFVASLVGSRLSPGGRAAVVSVLAAAAISSLQLAMSASLREPGPALATFLPLILSSCLPLTTEESCPPGERPRQTVLTAVRIGAGCLLVLLALGSLRELLGQGLLVALLPPGAFLLLGALLAAVNALRRTSGRRLAGASAPHA